MYPVGKGRREMTALRLIALTPEWHVTAAACVVGVLIVFVLLSALLLFSALVASSRWSRCEEERRRDEDNDLWRLGL